MAVNLTNLIDLDGLRAFKSKNDEARAAAITKALNDYKKNDFVSSGSGTTPGSIYVTPGNEAISGTGTFNDPYIVDFTVICTDSEGANPKYYKNTSSAESTASVASTSDIVALFS